MSQFASPSVPSSGISYKDVNGSLLLVQVLGVEDDVQTVHSRPGEKNPAVRATITVLDGPSGGEVYEDVLVFPKFLQAQLNRKVGELVLGRLGQGQAKAGQSAPWMLSEATPSDVQVADAHMRKVSTPSITSAEAPF